MLCCAVLMSVQEVAAKLFDEKRDQRVREEEAANNPQNEVFIHIFLFVPYNLLNANFRL